MKVCNDYMLWFESVVKHFVNLFVLGVAWLKNFTSVDCQMKLLVSKRLGMGMLENICLAGLEVAVHLMILVSRFTSC